jgi:hypothetical protein
MAGRDTGSRARFLQPETNKLQRRDTIITFVNLHFPLGEWLGQARQAEIPHEIRPSPLMRAASLPCKALAAHWVTRSGATFPETMDLLATRHTPPVPLSPFTAVYRAWAISTALRLHG